MQTPRSNVGAWVRAGRSASKSVLDNFETARAYSPDYTGMAMQGMKARTQEKIAAMKAESTVAAAKTDAKAHLAKTDMEISRDNAKRKARGQVAKGNMIAQAGGLIGTAFAKEEKQEAPDYSILRELYRRRGEELEADEAGFKPFERTIDPETMKPIGGNTRMAGEPAAAGLEDNVQPAANQQTGGSTVKPTGGGSVKPTGGGSTGLRLMNNLISKGYSPVSAAAIAGNAAHESGRFRHHEELKPNAYGTRGVGYLQWTDAGGGKRRSEFESWSKTQGLDPTSFEASAGYIDAEMRGNRHWTGGMTTESFKNITDLTAATTAFQNNYLRPGDLKGSLQQRQNYAKQFYDQYISQNK